LREVDLGDGIRSGIGDIGKGPCCIDGDAIGIDTDGDGVEDRILGGVDDRYGIVVVIGDIGIFTLGMNGYAGVPNRRGLLPPCCWWRCR